jgi:hypothetical protein
MVCASHVKGEGGKRGRGGRGRWCSANRALRCGNVVVQGSIQWRCHGSSSVGERWCGEKLLVEVIGLAELRMAV